MVKEDPYDWARRRAKGLFDHVEKWTDDLDVKYEKEGVWPVKKLLAIEWYIDPFYAIASKHFQYWYYIDFFCGSGLMLLSSAGFAKKHLATGSALAPLFLTSRFRFSEYFLFDRDPASVSALKKRITRLGLPSAFKINAEAMDFENSSKKLFGPSGKINRRGLSLVIIDPEGLDVSWSLLENILVNGKVDVILTVMTWSLALNHSNALKNLTGQYAAKMTEFFGDARWKDAKNSRELIAAYRAKIESKGYRTYSIPVERKGESVLYDLIFCTTNEKVGKMFQELVEIMEHITPELLWGAVGKNQGERNDLTDFFH